MSHLSTRGGSFKSPKDSSTSTIGSTLMGERPSFFTARYGRRRSTSTERPCRRSCDDHRSLHPDSGGDRHHRHADKEGVMKVGDRVTFAKLRRAGFSQCPVKTIGFTYWFNGDIWLKLVDNIIVSIFSE